MSRWTINIQCSNCGAREEVPNNLEEIGKRAEVWGSFGNALYCPECRRTWSERNSKPLAGVLDFVLAMEDDG